MGDVGLPSGRLGRLIRLAKLGASTGASLALSDDGARAAGIAAEVLGEMRGLAAKVGQMASYVDGMVPEGHRPAYERALQALQANAPSSSYASVKETIESELGGPVDRLFTSFEEKPFASASIGQVHRAKLEDGRAVAVKVQHPGIDKAVGADLANAGVVTSMLSTLGPNSLGVDGIFSEIRARFTEELDYVAEAKSQERFRSFHADDGAIVVPAVVKERSARRVITTEMIDGESLDEAATRPESERRAYAEVLWRFVFRSILVHRSFNADPHPGNYLFLPEGRVAFFDYGCVQPISAAHNRAGVSLHRAALDRDEAAFRRATAGFLETKGGAYEDAVCAYIRTCFEPLFQPSIHITRPYVASLVSGIRELKRFAFQKRSGFVQMRPDMLFMNRLQFGFYSVLARLDVDVSYASIEEEILTNAGLRQTGP
ncbi:MAG: AarF/ABC1/UbiB kinase family protein [Polyangiaceae bacterium]|nr:AarF/ABC1/UbiB kinase family protein [Polyangiaceae bacterium]